MVEQEPASVQEVAEKRPTMNWGDSDDEDSGGDYAAARYISDPVPVQVADKKPTLNWGGSDDEDNFVDDGTARYISRILPKRSLYFLL